jgi:hypothetical protein
VGAAGVVEQQFVYPAGVAKPRNWEPPLPQPRRLAGAANRQGRHQRRIVIHDAGSVPVRIFVDIAGYCRT